MYGLYYQKNALEFPSPFKTLGNVLNHTSLNKQAENKLKRNTNMKNTTLTKDMKYNIARAMYNVYQNKTMEYWWEFVQEIKVGCPVVTQVLHWNINKISSNITDSKWFRSYVLTGKYR